MSVDSRTEVIDASGQKQLSNANFFFLIASTAAVSVQLKRGGSTETFALTTTGLLVGRLQPWDRATIIGAAGTVLTFFYGYTSLREDQTDFRQTLATISGTVQVQSAPSVTLADTAGVSAVNAALTAIVPVNLTRRRVTLSIPSNAPGWAPNTVFFRAAGSVNNLQEVQPGITYVFEGTYAISVRNDCGTNVFVMIAEES